MLQLVGLILVCVLLYGVRAQGRGLGDACPVAADQAALASSSLGAVSPSICRFDRQAVNGSIGIGGLLSLHRQFNASNALRTCSGFRGWSAVVETEAFLLALQLLSDDFDREVAENFGGCGAKEKTKTEVGYALRDTCASDVLAVDQTLDLAVNATALNRFFIQRLVSQMSTGQSSRCSCTPPVLAVVGPGSDTEALRVSPLLSSLKIPHISYGAGSRVFTATGLYPYFFRTVPPHIDQVGAISQILRRFSWSYVAVFTSDDVSYGSEGLAELEQPSFLQNDVCFGIVEPFSLADVTPPYTGRMNATIDRLRNDPQAKVIILYALINQARGFITLLQARNVTDRFIIGSDDWISQMDFSVFNRSSGHYPPFSGLLGIGLDLGNLIRPGWPEELQKRLQNLSKPAVIENSNNPWLQTFVETTYGCGVAGAQSACSQSGDLDDDSHRLDECQPHNFREVPPIDRALSILTSAHSIMIGVDAAFTAITNAWRAYNYSACNYPSAEEISCALLRLQRPCHSPDSCNRTLFSDDHSTLPSYTLLNLQWGESGAAQLTRVGNFAFHAHSEPVFTLDQNRITWNLLNGENSRPESSCQQVCSPGYYAVSSTSLCCVTCELCGKYSFSNETTGHENCLPCGEGRKANETRTSCVDIERTYLDWRNGWVVTILVIGSLGAVTTIITIAVYWINRKQPVFRCGDLHLSTAILAFMLLAYASIPVILSKPSDAQCTARAVLSTLPPLLVISGIFVKTNRVARILAMSSLLQLLSKKRNVAMGTPMQLLAILVITAIGELIIGVGLVVNPSVRDEKFPNRDTVELVCEWTAGWQATFTVYAFLIVFVSTIVAFQTRKLPDNYNDAKLVFMASFATCVVWLGLVPAYYIDRGSLRPVILALSIVSQMWGTWFCLFLPRVYLGFNQRRNPRRIERRGTIMSVTGGYHDDRMTRTTSMRAQGTLRMTSNTSQLERSDTMSGPRYTGNNTAFLASPDTNGTFFPPDTIEERGPTEVDEMLPSSLDAISPSSTTPPKPIRSKTLV